MSVEVEYENLVNYLEEEYSAVAGQMFGKKCIKINAKACIALFKEYIVFKLPKEEIGSALFLEGSNLWDPSGKKRPMKEWVQIPLSHRKEFQKYAVASAKYVG